MVKQKGPETQGITVLSNEFSRNIPNYAKPFDEEANNGIKGAFRCRYAIGLWLGGNLSLFASVHQIKMQVIRELRFPIYVIHMRAFREWRDIHDIFRMTKTLLSVNGLEYNEPFSRGLCVPML